MPLRDLLHKKERNRARTEDARPLSSSPASPKLPQASEFTFLRSDTNTAERIAPPGVDGDAAADHDAGPDADPEPEEDDSGQQRRSLFRKSPSRARRAADGDDAYSSSRSRTRDRTKRLSQRLLQRSRDRAASAATSTHLPADLPAIEGAYSAHGDREAKEALWEERATKLAAADVSPSSSLSAAAALSSSPSRETEAVAAAATTTTTTTTTRSRSPSQPRSLSDADADTDIQEAIRLHEAGALDEATRMFGALAERGNVLSQVLYGLSLRHGWGCTPSPERAIAYLSSAASNSAEIERQALAAGMKRGGAAKGELVLAIFELANCFRYGWGCAVDKVAARQYYETAANLGDTDAMAEAAWCYLEGFGGPKDKFKAAQLLRLAEKAGASTVGNSWIWKEKYNPK